MRPMLTEEQFRPELRLRICIRCPLRPARGITANPDVAQRCEAACPLFLKLSELVRRAVMADPMGRSRERLLEHLVQKPQRDKPYTDVLPLRRHGREVARMLAKQIDL